LHRAVPQVQPLEPPVERPRFGADTKAQRHAAEGAMAMSTSSRTGRRRLAFVVVLVVARTRRRHLARVLVLLSTRRRHLAIVGFRARLFRKGRATYNRAFDALELLHEGFARRNDGGLLREPAHHFGGIRLVAEMTHGALAGAG
jgi:hypothetical protein